MRLFAVPGIRNKDGTDFSAGTAGKGVNEMASHLRELMECVDRLDVTAHSWLSDKYLDAAIELFKRQSQNAVCFEAGDPNDQDGMKIIGDLVRLPYPTCWIELHRPLDDGMIVVGGMLSERDGVLEGQVWTKSDGRWGYTMFFQSPREESNSKISGIVEEDSSVAATIIASFRMFLSALNCTNIRRVEHKPDAKLQKARAKRGKQPLFSYWTLELDLSRPESSESLGGTHASPRLHLRRGHPRQYAPGKWTWVQPCAVGNKKAGMVHKDYKVVAQ